MTAIIAFRQSKPHRVVHLVTDSLGVAAGGARVKVPKVVPLPAFHAALAVMGHTETAAFLSMELPSRADSFKAACAALPQALLKAASLRREAGASGAQLAVLVGWNGDQPSISLAATDASAGIEPGTSVDPGVFYAAPSTPHVYAAFALPADTDDIRPHVDPLRYMRIQRDIGLRDENGTAASDLIGGPVVLTSLYRDRLEQRVIGTLDDPPMRRGGLLGRLGF